MDEQRDLDGLSVLVTGASSGIGRAAAEELAGTARRSSCTVGTPTGPAWSSTPSPLSGGEGPAWSPPTSPDRPS